MKTLAASVFIAGMTVGIGWNGHGTMTLGLYLLAVVGAWCILALFFGSMWVLLVDHWRAQRVAETTRPGPSAPGRRTTPGLVATSPSPDAATTPSGLATRQSGLGVHPGGAHQQRDDSAPGDAASEIPHPRLVPNLGQEESNEAQSHAARERGRCVGGGDERPVAPLGRDQVSIRLHHQRTRWP